MATKLNQAAAIKKVKKSGYELRNLEDTFRDDEAVVLTAIENEIGAYKHASDRLRDDEKFFAKAVKASKGDVIQFASDRIRNNKKCFSMAIKSSWISYNYIGDDLKADKELLMLALDNNNNVFSNDTPLATCDSMFHSDKEIVKKAIKNWAHALMHASEELKDDRELVLMAVSDIGGSLEFASERLRNDKDVVLTAISNDPDAIEYASGKLKKDKDVVKASQG